MGAVIQVENVWEAYRPGKRRRLPWRGELRWALCDVSLSVDGGELIGLTGRNGSGKTTLLQVVAGVIRPTRGSVTTSGPVASLIDLTAGLHRDLTGRENVRIGGVLAGLSRRQARDRYEEIASFSGLSSDELTSPLSTYSAGMTLRLAFSLVAATRPSVLLLDEVLAVGDDAFRAKVMEWITSLRRGGGAALLASHDLALLGEHCDRVAVLTPGAPAVTGPPGEILPSYRAACAAEASNLAARGTPS